MRDDHIEGWLKRHPEPELREQLADWYKANPDGTLTDAVRDLELWHQPNDKDARWLVWRCMPDEAKQKLGPVW